jgi:hypothetical protein
MGTAAPDFSIGNDLAGKRKTASVDSGLELEVGQLIIQPLLNRLLWSLNLQSIDQVYESYSARPLLNTRLA